ncbi:hypothetical protein [Andreprevotia chitinilytica]|uniref:hypothetical protein n=1 Tax=Andreprevotia chitinilytica TaxID=396808 RepID=UPI00054F33ED|nr:hypothetical protein [Andreprevotia chitinilytica]
MSQVEDVLTALPACVAGEVYRLPPEITLVDQLFVELSGEQPGCVALLALADSLLSNLRVWENLILPACYHRHAHTAQLESRVVDALQLLNIEESVRKPLLDSLPSGLDIQRKRELVLARAFIQAPHYVLVEPLWLDWASDLPLWQALAAQSVVLIVGGNEGRPLLDVSPLRDQEMQDQT